MKEHTPETQPMSEDTKTIITVLTLISVPPVGVILMWIWNKWQTWVKLVVTGCTCLPFVFVLMAFALGFFGVIMSEVDNELNPKNDNVMPMNIDPKVNLRSSTTVNSKTTNIFNDVMGGYSVTYDGSKFTSCNPKNTFQKDFTLWALPYECTDGDAPYLFKVSKDDNFEYDSINPTEKSIMVDGIKGIQRTYNFTEADGPLYELGQLTVINVKSPKRSNITIEMAGSSSEDMARTSELLAGFKWN